MAPLAGATMLKASAEGAGMQSRSIRQDRNCHGCCHILGPDDRRLIMVTSSGDRDVG